ncbi:CPBP family intramembrane glutamic endopeptidase [Nocardiopsis aegyptia]|uniref:Membrane protease YdiL (CAAX protease family) n=1 Tax=Nocardiopsis aegyptia TaxID=220378 RepID=A0A7Z0ELX2_9ACTN|nr:CPBP family intramembrane glutamic endopeptidase [Nocardiopsis aegyptia]NYJ34299.1 membrane protease YdiL (CAAX protease family) [Nocardiopsis aegyptia]
MVRRWGLVVGLSVAALIIALPIAFQPVLRADVAEGTTFLLFVIWAPMLIGGVMAWAVVGGFGDRGRLDQRVRQALDGHPLTRELTWLGVFLCCFVLLMVLLSRLFQLYGAHTGADLNMSASLVSRLLFLFTLPILVMDRSGITVDGKGTAMPAVALKVNTPWRWLGLIPAAVVLILAGYAVIPDVGLPPLSLGLIGFVLAFALIAVCEEIFYRAMLQTRLEVLLGRWGGIVATTLVFALAYAFAQPFDEVSQLPDTGYGHLFALSLLSYGPVGLLYGYLWSCFRNIWINVIIRIGMFIVLMPPDLDFGILA